MQTKTYRQIRESDMSAARATLEIVKKFNTQGYVWTKNYSLEKVGDALDIGSGGFVLNDLQGNQQCEAKTLEDLATQLAMLEGPNQIIEAFEHSQNPYDFDIDVTDCGAANFENTY